MALPTAILLTYGYFLIFGWVLLEQVGLPLPATLLWNRPTVTTIADYLAERLT